MTNPTNCKELAAVVTSVDSEARLVNQTLTSLPCSGLFTIAAVVIAYIPYVLRVENIQVLGAVFTVNDLGVWPLTL